MKLNLGCGGQVTDTWINVDYAIGARLAKVPLFRPLNRKLRFFKMDWDSRVFIHDLRRPFPWAEASVDVVYSSHTLEHFTREHGLAFLSECRRVLKPAGIIRLVVPDLACIIKDYVSGALRADALLEQLGVLSPSTSRNPIKRLLAPLVEFPHKCMYDTSTLLAILRELGFDAEGRKPFESSIADIQRIELANRVERAAIVEGTKLR